MHSLIVRSSLIIAACAAAASTFATSHALAAIPYAVARPLADKPDDKKDSKDDKDKGNAEEIKTLATLCDRILSTDGMDGIGDCLAGNDRDRVEPELKKKHDAFTKLVTDFRDAWQKKYDDNYSMSTHTGILTAQRIEHVDHAGRTYAIVYFAEQAGKPSYEVHLVEEKSGEYRLVLPNTTSGEELAGRLERNLKGTFDDKAGWPKSEANAYAVTTHRLLYALRFEQPKTDTKTEQKK